MMQTRLEKSLDLVCPSKVLEHRIARTEKDNSMQMDRQTKVPLVLSNKQEDDLRVLRLSFFLRS